VVHTHRSLLARWISLRDHLGVAAFRKTLCMLPTHFGHGLICNSLFRGSRADLYMPPFRPDLVMRLGALVDEHEITFMSSVPPIWRLALRLARPRRGPDRAGALRVRASLGVHVGGHPGVDGNEERLQRVRITETGSWVAGLADSGCPAEDGLIGQGWGAVVQVLHVNDTNQPLDEESRCAAGEEGFVWLNTPALMKGYFRREDLTRKTVVGGWFMTGDIGLIDDRGRLVLRGGSATRSTRVG